jgi:hypothetical protein
VEMTFVTTLHWCDRLRLYGWVAGIGGGAGSEAMQTVLALLACSSLVAFLTVIDIPEISDEAYQKRGASIFSG